MLRVDRAAVAALNARRSGDHPRHAARPRPGAAAADGGDGQDHPLRGGRATRWRGPRGPGGRAAGRRVPARAGEPDPDPDAGDEAEPHRQGRRGGAGAPDGARPGDGAAGDGAARGGGGGRGDPRGRGRDGADPRGRRPRRTRRTPARAGSSPPAGG